MISTRNHPDHRGRRSSCILAWVLGGLYCVSAQGELLETVPADVAAVTIIRSPRAFLQKANAAAMRLSPDAKPITWADIETKLGPAAAGFCDIDQPLVIVLTRAEGEGGTLVVGSRVKPPNNLQGGPGVFSSPKGNATEGHSDRFYVRAGNITYVSHRRRPMRAFSRLRPPVSLAASMDPQEREFARSSDMFVYIRMEAWQERIRPYVQLVSTMAKFSVTAEPSENPTEQKMRSEVTNWFIDGSVSVLDQMSSVSLGLTLDGESIRLRHHHHFTSDGSVSKYLGKVRKSEEPPWACLPDRPFIAAFATNWWSPEQSSLILSLTKKVFQSVSEGGDISSDVQNKVINASADCYAHMRGMNMLMTLDSTNDKHLEMYGSYAFDDAAVGLKQMRVIQAHANEAMAAITPGGFVGRGVDIKRDGIEYNEVDMDDSVASAEFKEQMDKVYGEHAKVRQAKVGNKRVASCITQSADDFVKLVKAGETDQPLLANKRVGHMIGRMQPKAQAWLLLDLRRLMTLAGSVVAAQSDMAASAPARPGKTGGPQDKRKSPAPQANDAGPLLGWSAMIGDRFFSGEFLISLDDAAAAVRLTEEMVAQFRDDAAEPPTD